MNYEEFKDKIYQELQKVVKENTTIACRKVNKNNGVVLDELIEDMLNVVNESKGTTEQELISSTMINGQRLKRLLYFRL